MIALMLASALAAPVAVVGERLGEAEVVDQIDHSEFIRLGLRLPDGQRLDVELKPTVAGHQGACEAQGWSVYPRWEQLGREVELEDQPASIRAICQRLSARASPPALGSSQPQRREPSPRDSGTVQRGSHRPLNRERPEQALALVWALSLPLWALSLFRRQPGPGLRDLGLLLLISAGMRLAFSPRGLSLGVDAGYEILALSWGTQGRHAHSGDGWPGLLAALSEWGGRSPAVLFRWNLLVSSLSPLVAMALAWRLGGPQGRTAGWVAGLGLALLPVHLRLSAGELHQPTLLLLGLLGLLSLPPRSLGAEEGDGGSIRGALSGALGLALAAQIRPEALPLTLMVGAVWLVQVPRGPQRAVALGAAALCLGAGIARALSLPDRPAGPLQSEQLYQPWTWLRVLRPHWSGGAAPALLVLELGMVAPLVPLLAGRSLVAIPGRWLGLLWLGMTLPLTLKSWPAMDGWRLQLPGLGLACVAMGLGAALHQRAQQLGRNARHRRVPWFLGGLLALWCLLRLPAASETWAPQAESLWLMGQAPALPPDSVVLFPAHSAHGANIGEVGSALSAPGVVWVEMGAELPSELHGRPLIVWEGLTCAVAQLPGRFDAPPLNPCEALRKRCTLEPWLTTELPRVGDVDLRLPDGPVVVGFYRVKRCQEN